MSGLRVFTVCFLGRVYVNVKNNFRMNMKIGYPCINRTIGCTANSTFRLANYSQEKLIETVDNNLACLQKILEYNVAHDLLFFRISSDIIPFASHPVCRFEWRNYFTPKFYEIGNYIKKHKFRISMHPDQFILLNAKDTNIVKKSIAELIYQCDLLDLMELDQTAKVQIHVGGVYGDKASAIARFIKVYNTLPQNVQKRLVIEHDDHRFSLQDCLQIYEKIKIPVVFDTLHYECFNAGEPVREALLLAAKTWNKNDGPLMVDYSEQEKGKRKGTHAQTIDVRHFEKFLHDVNFDDLKKQGLDCDIMLEIKDKEKSALKARS
ncbi:UV DNA damage repair endonuclease UvsE, partial [Candidatus Dependentiae bacterium]